jgi:hypothetical protein
MCERVIKCVKFLMPRGGPPPPPPRQQQSFFELLNLKTSHT